ncbi:TPA: hypothetical protein ACU3NZ_000001, partial [Staphylococcus aureus]
SGSLSFLSHSQMFKLRSFCENKDNNYSFYISEKSVYDNN